MAKEIERKFLVDMNQWRPEQKGTAIKQGFIPTAGHTVVRIRISGDKAYLTIKGKNTGSERSEFEYSIPVCDAEQMLQELCERPFIEKTRYRTNFSRNTWEIDVFHKENEGLTVAEIELESVGQKIDLPPWVSREVTDDPRYYNVNLVKHPFTLWR
jgi:adenylate cyclase